MASDEEKKVDGDINSVKIPVELLGSRKQLKDILCDPNDADEKQVNEQLKAGYAAKKRLQKTGSFQSMPDMILSDWLWLGNARDAFNLPLLKNIGITHILNVTREVGNYHLFNKKYSIKYAKISLDDTMMNSTSIFDYFSAAKSFIDECNPLNNNNNGNKVLVHCAAGISRSSTIIISYLITSIINMNNQELNRLKYINQCLSADTFKHKMKDSFSMITKQSKINKEIESHLNDQQKLKLKTLRNEYHDDRFLKLNEAFYFVKSCRERISPNFGFCNHLQRYEILYHNGKDTLCDLPKYTDWDNDTTFWKEARNRYPIQRPDIIVPNSGSCVSCLSCMIL